MLTKDKVLESIKELPDTFSADEIIDRIILLDKIETGIAQVKNNQITPDDDLNKKLSKWLD